MSETRSFSKFGWALLRERPVLGVGIGLALLLRYLYGLFYLFATINKYQRNYLFSDYPLEVFTNQLAVIDPDGLMAAYLTGFIIPNYRFVAIVVVVVWTLVTIGLLLGLCTRWAAALAVFATVNIGLGGDFQRRARCPLCRPRRRW